MKASASLFKNFTSLFSGLLFVQIINFLFSLVLPKYFTPEAFAEFGIFTSMVFILAEIVNARLDIAVMLGKDEHETKKIVNAAFTNAVILFAILQLVCIPVYFLYSKIYIFFPLTILLYGIHQPTLVYLNKKGNYKAINTFRFIQVITTSTVTLALGMENITHALIYGFIIGLLLSTMYLYKFVQPKFNIPVLREIIKEYDQFPKYGTWSSLLNNISRNSLPVLLSQFFSRQMVGYYSYATRLLNAPTGMYTSALGQVYFKTASEQDRETLKASTRKITNLTFFTALLPSVIILIFGKQLFFLLFSGSWLEAGVVSQYLILWYFIGVIASPISCLLDLKNKLQFEFRYNLVLFLLRIISIGIGGLSHNFYLSILLFSISGIILNLYLLYYIHFVLLEE